MDEYAGTYAGRCTGGYTADHTNNNHIIIHVTSYISRIQLSIRLNAQVEKDRYTDDNPGEHNNSFHATHHTSAIQPTKPSLVP